MTKKELLKKLRKKWKDHDFCGGIMDDEWHDHVVSRAIECLTDSEMAELERLEEEGDDDAVGEGIDEVVNGFVRYLSGKNT